MPEKNERFFKVRGRSISGVRYRGVISSKGSATTSFRWSTKEEIRIVPESVYNECKADNGLVIVKLEEVSAEEAQRPQPAPKSAAHVDLSTLSSEELFAELERRDAAKNANGADEDEPSDEDEQGDDEGESPFKT